MSEHELTRKGPAFTGTGEPLNTITTNKQAIIDFLHTRTAFSIESGFSESKVTTNNPNADKVSYPVVVILSGAGGNGKTTFINAVGKACSAHHISVIDPVKNMASQFISIDQVADCNYPWMPTNAAKEKAAKSDRYRQFLFALKMAWAEYDDGPTHYAMGELFRAIGNQLVNGDECHDVVFIECREPDEIRKLVAKVQEAGLIPLTVIIHGLTDPSSYQNGSDSQVDGYNYDLDITNSYGSEETFILQATMFAKMLSMANNVYGIKIDGNTEEEKVFNAVAVNASEIASGVIQGDVTVTTSDRVAPEASADGPDQVSAADPMLVSAGPNPTATGEGAGYPDNQFHDNVGDHPAS